MKRRKLLSSLSVLTALSLFGAGSAYAADILLIRFCIGFAAIYLLSFKGTYQLTRKQNLYLVAAGFLGICLYYLLEDIALTYTQATSVSSCPSHCFLLQYFRASF